jgi:hypothetical protein
MNKIDDRLYHSFLSAYEATDKVIGKDASLSEDFHLIRFFSTQLLANCFRLILKASARWVIPSSRS